MPVTVALIGADQAGKSTLFRALTQGRAREGVGMVDIPDQRLDRLAQAVKPKRVVRAQVRVSDAPAGSPGQRIAAAREADVVIKVARCFGPDPDPVGELEGLEVDLALTDLATVEKRLEVVERDERVGKKHAPGELDTLRLVRQHLDGGHGLGSLELEPEPRAFLQSLFPVSDKPAIYVANVDDGSLPDGGEAARAVQELAQERGARAIVVCAQLESELAELEPAEAAEMRASFRLAETTLEAVAQAVWSAGGLVTYFTAGEPEVRAWACQRDAPAPVAAGVIHSDFEKRFIKAEVTSVDELVEAGSMEALRAAGNLRLEGRDYRVQDGDVVFFRVGR
jgi:GTP-binding protein YchF